MSEKMYHIDLSIEDIEGAKYVILPGDPGRVPKIAAMLDGARQLAYNREYNTWLGKLNGENVLVTSTGIGGPSASIAVEELRKLGVEYFVRIGTCGGMQMEVEAGDCVIASAAIRAEGTSREYLPIEFPAVADFEVTTALKLAADRLKVRSHVGVVECKDSFYGQHAPESMPVDYELLNRWSAWIKGGALASEMESAALFTVCATRRAKAGAVFLVVWNQERAKAGITDQSVHDTTTAIKVAVEAVGILIDNNAKGDA